MIISASRRTDIPAFYSEWFMNRIAEGFMFTQNPFNSDQISRISLKKEDVDAIVFWTRNAEKLIPYFPTLDSKGFNYYFQYTVTGYPRTLEKSVPQTVKAIETFCRISDMIGPARIVWRYDPILVSNLVDISEHKRLFSKIAAMLEGKTKRVVISVADMYKKTERNLKKVEGLIFSDLTLNKELLLELAEFMSTTAKLHGMEIQSCAEKIDLSLAGIDHGKCIDEKLLRSEFGLNLSPEKDKGQREECGCIKSVDIGQYNTCLHGCSYCYATFNENTVITNKRKHDPTSPFLIGGIEDRSKELLREIRIQSSIFD